MLGNIDPYVSFQVLNNTSTYTIDLADNIKLYKLYTSGTITMANSLSIGVTGTPVEGTHIEIDYTGRISLSGTLYTVTVLGVQIGQEALLENTRIICDYTNSAWAVKVLKTAQLSEYRVIQNITMGTSGTVTLTPGTNGNYLKVSGSPTLSGNYTITGTVGNNGDVFEVFYEATPDTSNGSHVVSIFGYTLTDAQAVAGALYIKAISNGSTWNTKIINDSQAEGVIPVSALSDQSNEFLIGVPISFEANEKGEIWIPLINPNVAQSNKIKINAVDYNVIKTVAGTDDGSISIKLSTLGINNPADGAELTNFPLIISSGTTVGTAGTVVVGDTTSTTNQYLVAEGSKTTSGGRIFLYLRCEKVSN